MKKSLARKNWVTNTMKTIRDNETRSASGTDLETRTSESTHLEKGDYSEILYAIIRYLNYLYDSTTDENRKEAILDKKARVLLQLIMMEEVEHEGKKLPSRKRVQVTAHIMEER